MRLAKYDGYQEHTLIHLLNSQEQYLNIQNYVTLYRRGKLSREKLDAYFKAYSLAPEEVDNFLNATEFFPSPNDLIRFAVREVYTPEIRQQFGMDEDLPQQFIAESSKAGLPAEQAANYWASHWELPSVNMGFEMLHRRIVNRTELNALLKSLDIMPFWRDKLIDLSYNVLTRVDTRRMYGMGVLNEQEVYETYLDQGYSPKDAENLTKFTVLYENNENTGLTKSAIVNAYRDDLISKEELRQNLQALDYSEKVINFTLESVDFDKTLDTVNRIKDDLIEGYLLGDLTIEDIRDKLTKYNLPTTYVERVIKDVVLQDAKRRKVPAKNDLLKWLEKQIIDDVYFAQRMRLLGYKDDDIVLYLTEFAINRDTSYRKYLSTQKYEKWLASGVMTEKAFTAVMEEQNVSEADINRMILDAKQ